MYCVECGKEGKLFDGLCSECFKRKSTFFKIPKVIKITLCSLCYARQKANHWEEPNSADDGILEGIIEKIDVTDGIKEPQFEIDLKPQMTNVYLANIKISSNFQELALVNDLSTEVRINYRLCPRCSRQSGSYFEAIVQVRGRNRKLDKTELNKAREIVESIILSKARSEENAFLTKSEYIHGGIDFYIGSNVIARQISKRLATEFAGKIKESPSLIGRKEGRDLFRTTYNVRVPEYRVGDFVKLNEEIYQIANLLPKKVLCLSLRTGQTQSMKQKDLVGAKLLGGNELIYDAIIVLESETEMQVLEPESLKTIELIKPDKFESKGESVKIFKHQDSIFIIPNHKYPL